MTQDSSVFGCQIGTTDASVPLSMRVVLNGQVVLEILHVTETVHFEYTIPDSEQEYTFAFEMSGKTADHTKLDDHGNIIKDACLTVLHMNFDKIDIGNILTSAAKYTHNFNGCGEDVVEKFYGDMGCNGQVTLKFSSPIYLWLLESM